MLATLYRRTIPKKIRDVIYQAFLGDLLMFYRQPKEILKHIGNKIYYSFISPKSEKEKAYKAWGIAGYSPYPYVWKKEYDRRHYEVMVDSENGLPYVLHNGKRLYFKRNSENSAEAVYRALLIEQDTSRINTTSDEIDRAVKEVAKMILRLYKEFAVTPRLIRTADDKKSLVYFKNTDLTTDDIVFMSDSTLYESLTSKREHVLQLLSSGLLSNEKGEIDKEVKRKILELFGMQLMS